MKPLLALSLGFVFSTALADEAAIRKVLAERYPMIPVKSVTQSVVPGIYEVWGGGRLFHTDEKADHIFAGPLIETASKIDLSKKRTDELRTVKFDSLPLDKAIQIVKGKGERKLAVFSDPDCPYCKRLEKELALLDNTTVYLFLYPLDNLHPKAPEVARNIWCSPDRVKSWLAYTIEGKAPEVSAPCDNPVKDIADLAANLGIDGTPALIFSNGKRMEGYAPAARIEEMLKQGS